MWLRAHLPHIFLFCDINQGTGPFVGPLPSLGMVAARLSIASLGQLRFRNTNFFKAGEIYNHLFVWEQIKVPPLWILCALSGTVSK